MVCVDVADSAGILHTSTAESRLWAQPLYCMERATVRLKDHQLVNAKKLYLHHYADSRKSILKPSRGLHALPYAAGL